MLKRLIFLVAGIAALVVAIALIVLTSETSDYAIRQNLNVYENARLIFEDRAVYGGGIAQRSLYYWSNDALLSVEAYYEQMMGTFITSEDRGREWSINAYSIDDSLLSADLSSSFLTHGSFCPDFRDRTCVSVALVAANQPDIYTLPIMSPSQFRRSTAPSGFQSVNPQGTFIVYSYWVKVF